MHVAYSYHMLIRQHDFFNGAVTMHMSRSLSGIMNALAYTQHVDTMIVRRGIPQDAVKNMKPNALPLLSEGW